MVDEQPTWKLTLILPEYSHETIFIPILIHELLLKSSLLLKILTLFTILLLNLNHHYSLFVLVSVSSYFLYIPSHKGNIFGGGPCYLLHIEWTHNRAHE